MLPRPSASIASIASIPATAITSALLILATNPIALAAEHLPRSSVPVPNTLNTDFALPSSLLLAQSRNALRNEGVRLFNQGQQQFNVSQFREALQSWQRALEIFQSIGDKQAEAAALANLGSAYFSLGQYDRIIDKYLRS